MEICGQLHAPADLSSGKDPQYSFDRLVVGPRAVLEGAENKRSLYLARNRTPIRWLSSPFPSRYAIRGVSRGYVIFKIIII
jgi:hypothetical protein